MNTRFLYGAAALLAACLTQPALAAPADDISALRRELQAMRADYESRLRELEARLAAAENALKDARATAAAAAPPATAAPPAPAPAARAATGNAFNPAISLILNGTYADYSGARAEAIPGFSAGGESGPIAAGFALGESELAMSANIDDRFYGKFTAAVASEDGSDEIEIEEAFVQTLALPAGLTARAGRFYSRLGYLNDQHRHTDDFADRPLPYRALLGNQYRDDGVQLRWLAPTDTFIEASAEWLRGDGYPAGGAANDGKGAWSAALRAGGDWGMSHSWAAGIGVLHTRAEDRESGDEDSPDLFTGDSTLAVADFVWKWAPGGDRRVRHFKLQGEYLWRNEDGVYNGAPYDADQSGWYLQGVYQFAPRWRTGVRYARLRADDPGADFAGSALDPAGHKPAITSVMLEWNHSEYSRVRLQFNADDSAPGAGDQWVLQYQMSLGAHGAHAF